MRRDSTNNPFKAKRLARQEYAHRQIDKFVKWSWEAKGKVKSIDIDQLHKRYGIVCHAKTIINNERE
jgi:hypothetical protein